MSQDDSFFDNLWDATENLHDAAVDVTEGLGHVAEGYYHSGAAVVNAAFGYDAEDRQDMVEHYDAAGNEAAAAAESFGDAWDEIF